MANVTDRLKAALPTAEHTSDILEGVGQFGYVTRGVIYGLIGILVANTVRVGGSTTDPKGVIAEMGSQPFGQILLWTVAFGLAAYALFRGAWMVRDPEGTDEGFKKVARRVGYGISGILHGSLSFFTFRLAMGAGKSGLTEKQRSAELMSYPGGSLALVIIGIIIGVVAFIHFKKAYSKDFMRHYGSARLQASRTRWLERIGQFGLAARGVTFAMIGWFLIKAGLDHNPREVVGLRGAFDELASQTYGSILLLVVALGFVAFGIYSITRGVYGRLRA